MAAILWTLPINYNVSQVDRVLSTLVTAQASIVAIVFSVSILGVQLVANRYSARMTTLITSSASFQRTLLFLGVSIGIDLLLLLQLPVLSAKTTMAGVAVVGGLAVASGLVLVRYVETTLKRSTPEGLLVAYTDEITAEDYQEQVIDSREQDEILHPMHELHSFVMSGLSNGEWATAENGLVEFERVSIRMLRDLAEAGQLHRSSSLARFYFKTPIEEYLPRITAQAIEDGENDLSYQAVRSMGQIAEAGLKHHFPLILTTTSNGLSEIIRNAPDGEKGDSIRRESLRVYSNLLTTAAEYPYPKDMVTLLSLYASQYRSLLYQDREPWVYGHELEEFFGRAIRPAHKQTLDQYGEYIDDLDVDWDRRTKSTEIDNSGPYNLLFAYRRYSVEVIGYILNYYSRNEEWPVNMSTLQDTWSNMAGDAIAVGADEYSRSVCRWYIDLAYLVSQVEGGGGNWARGLAIIQDDRRSAKIVDDTFERALENGLSAVFESERRKITPASESKSFFNKIMNSTPSHMQEYEEWVEDFRDHVNQRRQLDLD